jgi:type I restriction enzyme S subunit
MTAATPNPIACSQETPLPLYKETNFKDSPIGKIPRDWTVKTAKEIGEVITGITPSTLVEEYWNGDYPFVTPTDITEKKYVKKTERKVSTKGLEKGRIIPKDSVLVTCIASIGKIALAFEGCLTNQQINAIICKNEVNPHYVYYAIGFRTSVLESWAGKTTSPIVKKSLFEKFPIPMPTNPSEQRAIVGVLGVVDSAIELSDQIIAKTERLKRGLMQQLLTRGIGHTETKQTPIGNIPKEWEPISLSKVFKLSSGKPRPANISVEASPEAPYPIYGGNGVLGYSSKFLLNRQTIVIGRVGEYCGAVYKSSERSWITDNALYATELSNNFDITFLKYLLSFMNLNKFQKKMGQPLITQTILYGIDVPRPPLAEQLKIVDVLSTADRKLELENKERLRLETIKWGLMDLLLTGKVRIKVD